MSQRVPKSNRLAMTCVIDSQHVFHAFGQSTLEATRIEPRSGLPSIRMPMLHSHRVSSRTSRSCTKTCAGSKLQKGCPDIVAMTA
eukprot:11554365-Heterocapsa_arctica.AAC.1